jgi:acyl-coenzyme A thioesterase PaaI-like protein
VKHTPKFLKRLLNIYGPYFGAGVKVEHISSDWKQIRVSMKLRWYNRNIFGIHFGGSLYSMADPHFVIMLVNLLGNNYLVLDKSATIDFLRPAKGKVFATFEISDDELEIIRMQTDKKRKSLPEFTTTILDENQKAIARIYKVLYVRKKRSDNV